MITIYHTIGLLVGVNQSSHPLRGDELSSIATLQNAYLVVENESIHSYGVMANLQWDDFPTATRINVEGGAIFPS